MKKAVLLITMLFIVAVSLPSFARQAAESQEKTEAVEQAAGEQTTKAAPEAEKDMMSLMKEMREIRNKMKATEDPEQRAVLMKENKKLMQQCMSMMDQPGKTAAGKEAGEEGMEKEGEMKQTKEMMGHKKGMKMHMMKMMAEQKEKVEGLEKRLATMEGKMSLMKEMMKSMMAEQDMMMKK